MVWDEERARATAAAYDDAAEAVGWFGPEVALGLAYKYVGPGQSILGIGIGTGLAPSSSAPRGCGCWARTSTPGCSMRAARRGSTTLRGTI